MNDFFTNGIVQGVIVGILLLFISWIMLKARDKKIETKVIAFLENSNRETDYIFRSTNSISSELNLNNSKVNNICSSSKEIARNKNDRESWKLRK